MDDFVVANLATCNTPSNKKDWLVLKWEMNGMFGLHPGKITWNIIMEVWKIIFLSKWVVCMFHVNLPGCIGMSGCGLAVLLLLCGCCLHIDLFEHMSKNTQFENKCERE